MPRENDNYFIWNELNVCHFTRQALWISSVNFVKPSWTNVIAPTIVHIIPVKRPIYIDGKNVEITDWQPATIVERDRIFKIKIGINKFEDKNIQRIQRITFNSHDTLSTKQIFKNLRCWLRSAW